MFLEQCCLKEIKSAMRLNLVQPLLLYCQPRTRSVTRSQLHSSLAVSCLNLHLAGTSTYVFIISIDFVCGHDSKQQFPRFFSMYSAMQSCQQDVNFFCLRWQLLIERDTCKTSSAAIWTVPGTCLVVSDAQVLVGRVNRPSTAEQTARGNSIQVCDPLRTLLPREIFTWPSNNDAPSSNKSKTGPVPRHLARISKAARSDKKQFSYGGN